MTDWLSHTPKSVLAKNFGVDESAFDRIPGKELYIFPAATLAKDTKAPTSAQGTSKTPYTFKASQMPETKLEGGSVKIVDSSNFNASTTIAMAEVTVEPGHVRYVIASNTPSHHTDDLCSELHWHPTQDEWTYFLWAFSSLSFRSLLTGNFYSEGTGRVTLFASSANARTFNFQVS